MEALCDEARRFPNGEQRVVIAFQRGVQQQNLL